MLAESYTLGPISLYGNIHYYIFRDLVNHLHLQLKGGCKDLSDTLPLHATEIVSAHHSPTCRSIL